MASYRAESKSISVKKPAKPFAFGLMQKNPGGLDRLDIQFRWGDYGFRVLRCHLASFPPGKVVGLHKHSEYEFHFIPRGKGSVVLEGRTYSLHEGMFYLTGPNVLHYQEADSVEAMDELCLHIDIVHLPSSKASQEPEGWGAEWEIREAEECVKRLQQMEARPVLDQYNAMQWFLTAYRAWHDNDPCFLTTIKHAIIQILVRSSRVFADEEPPIYMPSRDMNAYRYLLATQFIQDNYASPITLEEVAERVHISGRQLQRIFREQSSETFSEYLENIRLSRVCSQLLQSDFTMEQIAAENGFTSSNYLFYVFKKRFQMTPKQYKQLHGATPIFQD